MAQARSNTIVRRVAVTGAGGFLGSAIVRFLAAAELRVTALARTAPAGFGASVDTLGWDGTRPAPDVLTVNAVVDCAAAIPARIGDPDVLVSTNAALAGGAVALAARTAAPLVYMSSQSAIGRPAVAVIDDDTPPDPDTPYGRSKLTAERAIAAAVFDGRLAGAVALRLPAVIGPGCHDNFPATIAARLAAGETVPVFNPDGPYNAVVHAETVAAFVRHLLTAPPAGFRAVSLASRPPIPVRAAVEAVAAGLGVDCRLDLRPAGHPSPTIDPSGAEALGFVADDTREALTRFGAETALHIATPRPPR